MTTGELAYPFLEASFSAILTESEVTALRAADLSTAALAGNVVTISGQTYDVVDLNHGLLASIEDGDTAPPLRRTATGDNAETAVRGRPAYEWPVVFYTDYTAGSTYDMFVKDPTGFRLMYIERVTGVKLVAVFQVFDNKLVPTDESDLTITATLRNALNKPART